MPTDCAIKRSWLAEPNARTGRSGFLARQSSTTVESIAIRYRIGGTITLVSCKRTG